MKISSYPYCKEQVYLLKTLFVLFTILLIPLNLNAQSQKISLTQGQKTILSAFEEIEAQTNMNFAYNESVINVSQVIDVNITDKSLSETLGVVLNGTNTSYRTQGKQIIIIEAPKQAPLKRYTGVILDEDGESVIGATVLLKGSPSIGTTTDVSGQFTLDVPAGSTLLISFIGFVSQEIKLGDNTTLKITLKEDSETLQEVVVIGYGVMRKSDLTGSLANVKASELSMTAPTVGQALVGRIAGVQVSQPSGSPGEGAKIRIRGVNSLSASSDPLYVIDGYPASEDVYINPEDIETIDVLKDAASAAIYGSRGAGGVVMITTKRGNAGKVQVDYDFQYSNQQLERKIQLLNARQFRDLVIEARNNSYRDRAEAAGRTWNPLDDNAARAANGFSLAEVGIDPVFFDFTTGKPVEPLYDTDWQDALYSNAPMTRHNISVSGGNDGVKYRLSLGHLNQDGIISPSNHKRLTVRSNVDANLTKRLKVGASISFSDVNDRKVQASGRFINDGLVQTALMSYPQFPVYNKDGSFAVGNQIAMKADGYAQVENPVALAHEIDITQQESRVNLIGKVSYDILKQLSISGNMGAQYTTRRYNYYRPRSVGQDGDMPFSSGAEARALATDVTNYDIDKLGEITLNFKEEFGLHRLDGVAGFSMQRKTYDRVAVEAKGFSDDRIHEITAHGPDPANTSIGGDTRKAAWSLMSYLGRINYFYDNRYAASATLRTDGSSRFGPQNKWGLFPSMSLGWTISNESFYKNTFGNKSSLKLRTSWGLSGNNNIGNYEVYSTMSQGGYPFGGGVSTAYWQGGFKDQAIGWEKTSQYNAGLDLSLFSGRVSLISNYYNSQSYDLLYDLQVSAISGSTSVKTNMENAKVQNNGFDFQADTRILTGEFKWNLSANISFNRNKVLNMGGINDIYSVSERNVVSYVTRSGLPVGSFYGYQVDGIISETDYANILIDKTVWSNNGNSFPEEYVLVGPAVPNYNNIHAGDTKWKDVNADGRITEDDRDVLGNAYPDFTYGISTDFAYKGFDLRATFAGSQGAKVINFQKYYLFGMEGYSNQLISALDRWRSEENPGRNNVHRATRMSTPNISTRLSSYMIDDASYLRCTNITLGYNFPTTWISKLQLQTLRVYVSADNLFTITKYEGYNPDVDYKGNNLMPGFDWGDYPLSRTYSIGAKVTF